MHFIVNIQREKESRMSSRSRSEDISLGRHALTSKPRLTPRLGLLVIRSVTDVLRAQSRFVKFVEGEAAGQPSTHFTNLLWVRSTSVTDLITNLSRRQPLFS